MPKPHVLVPELVPSDLWGRSASKMLGRRASWIKHIRPDAISQAQNRCELCGIKADPLICHDKWVYDKKKAMATLSRFEIHCRNCDSVTHIGRLAKVLGPENAIPAAILHLCNVNKCDQQMAVKILKDALFLWEKRNKKKWKINVAPELLNRYPDLAELPNFKPS